MEEGSPHERPHKPLLLLAAFDLIDAGLAMPDRIPWCQELRDRFSARFLAVRKHNDQNNEGRPFRHQASDGLWLAKPPAVPLVLSSLVFLGFHREVAELGAGFEVEAGEQAGEVAEAVAGDFAFEFLVGLVEEGFLADGADVVNGFVGDVLYGGDDGELEILGDGEGVLVGGFVEAV